MSSTPLFSCRGTRFVRGLVLSVGVFCTGLPALHAAPDVGVVPGSREPLAPERLAADVVVIPGDTLRDGSADSLADALRRAAGLQLSRSGGPGQSSGLFIRGTASQQSVVLVDGVRVGSATLGYAAVEGLSLAALDRIEVLRGPGSSLYGADAVGGVVNLITRRGSSGLQGDARVAVGGYGAREASAGLRGADERLDFNFALAHEGNRGVSALRAGDAFGNHNPDRDGYRLNTLQAGAGIRPAAGHRIGLGLLQTRLNAQYDASEFLPPTFTQNAAPDFRNRLDTTVAALDWRGTLAAGWTGSMRVSRSEDEANAGGTVIDRFRTVREQGAAQLAWQTAAYGQWVLALEHERAQAQSTLYSGDKARSNNAAVLAWTGQTAAADLPPLLSWQFDLRRDDNSQYGAVDTGRAGGAMSLAAVAPGLRLRALAGSSFRAPSFNDTDYPGYGVPTLRPERGQSVELGVDWRGADDSSRAALTIYRNRVRDLVGFTSDKALCPPEPAYAFGCAANVSRAQLQGATLSGAQRFAAFGFSAQLDWLRARNRDSGARLPRRADRQATLGADWRIGDWTVGSSLLHIGKRPDGGRTLAAESTIDINVLWRFAPLWTVQAKLLNATDRNREPAADYQGLGRQAVLSLRYALAL
ncbi:MAG: TonB-dependent receptor [Rubrivivax sp.]|nr:TonB-dependent receptor [Rubrivivax sp.]